MRVLASIQPGTGHLLPVVPTLRALRDAGHDVVVASSAPLLAEVEAAGLSFLPVGPAFHESAVDAALPGFRAAGALGQIRMWVDLAPRVLPDLLAAVDRVRPDLVLREPWEFAAWLASDIRGLPMVVHGVGSIPPASLLAAAAGEPLAAMRAAAGLPPDPQLDSLFGSGLVTSTPVALRFLPVQLPPVPQRHVRLPLPPPAPLPFARVRPRRPLVYVTLGTVFGATAGLLRTLVGGVADLDVEAVVTTGRAVEPASLGSLPAHVHAVRFLPQQDVLAEAAVIVCHAGYGTVYGALSTGLPLVVAPISADQGAWAMGTVLAGAAVSLAPVPPPDGFLTYATDPASVTPRLVAEATARALTVPAFREAARRIAGDIAAAPDPASIVPWLEALAGPG